MHTNSLSCEGTHLLSNRWYFKQIWPSINCQILLIMVLGSKYFMSFWSQDPPPSKDTQESVTWYSTKPPYARFATSCVIQDCMLLMGGIWDLNRKFPSCVFSCVNPRHRIIDMWSQITMGNSYPSRTAIVISGGYHHDGIPQQSYLVGCRFLLILV